MFPDLLFSNRNLGLEVREAPSVVSLYSQIETVDMSEGWIWNYSSDCKEVWLGAVLVCLHCLAVDGEEDEKCNEKWL